MIHPLIEKCNVGVVNDSVVASETVSPVFVEEEKKPTYTKTAINRMSTSELQKLANSLGFEKMSGFKLKEKLIEHFGL